jgi:hypothetical protein
VRLYAELPATRARQLLGDGLVLAWSGFWLWAGVRLHELVVALAVPGERLEGAGRGLAASLGRAGRAAADLPLAGEVLAAPLTTARDAARAVAAAGQAQQDAVARLAFWLGLLVVVLPVGWALARWVPGRLRWMRDVRAISRLCAGGGLELLAWRALANRPLPVLARAGVADPAAALRAGDPAAVARLAALEVTAVGLRLPPPPVSRRRQFS